MIRWIPYNRRAAVQYAKKWAFGRNPAYYNFDEIGGDCTNFASQCLYAGTGVMNYTPEFGWYYIDPEQRAPAWTGVPYFWNFMTRTVLTAGPFGFATTPERMRLGDFVQIRFRSSGEVFAHTPIVVSVGFPPTLDNILVAAHSNDALDRPLSSYTEAEEFRFLHISGAIAATADNGGRPPRNENNAEA